MAHHTFRRFRFCAVIHRRLRSCEGRKRVEPASGVAIFANLTILDSMDTQLISRVRIIMDRSGQSNSDFALAIATTPDKLSKSLGGSRRFTTTELALVAELGETTVEWLLTGKERPTPSMAARTSSVSSPDASTIEGIARRFTEASEQLRLLREASRELSPLPSLASTWSQVYQGEQLAADARKMIRDAGRTLTAGEDLIPTLEAVFQVDVAVVDMPGGLDGCAWQTDEQRLIIANKTTRWARQRFTLAHELGHILACDAQELISETMHSENSKVTEMRANAFAASFLVPEDEVVPMLEESVTQSEFITLVNHFKVSPQSMAYRLKNLRKLDDISVRNWGSMTAESCAAASGHPEIIADESNKSDVDRLPPRLVAEHVRLFWDGQTSARPLASLLDVDPGFIIEKFRPVVAQSESSS